MAKIALIGAGSRGFAKRFVMDIMTRPALADATLSMMDIDRGNLDVTTALAKKMARQLDVPTVIESTTDRREALDRADYVISTVLLHGVDVYDEPLQIARKYGVDQAVGCTCGPGGVFMLLRYMPFQAAVLKEMEALCPDCLYIHYSNPTTMVPWAMNLI
jgi:alpha-galactosidase